MNRLILCVTALTWVLAGVGQATADSVYLLGSGVSAEDNAAYNLLTADGHTVTIGTVYTAFSGPVPTGTTAVILLGNDTVDDDCRPERTFELYRCRRRPINR